MISGIEEQDGKRGEKKKRRQEKKRKKNRPQKEKHWQPTIRKGRY